MVKSFLPCNINILRSQEKKKERVEVGEFLKRGTPFFFFFFRRIFFFFFFACNMFYHFYNDSAHPAFLERIFKGKTGNFK